MSRTLGLTVLALVAFAANSVLTREALGSQRIDAASFTAIRLASGAAVLALLVLAQSKIAAPLRGRGAIGPLALFAYAAPFSFAYLRIGAAVGALVLFGVVQLTMLGYALRRGERPSPAAWLGLVTASSGLVALLLPSAGRPDPLGIAMMAVAGVAWAVYTIAGRTAPDPLAANARGFLWSVPLAVALVLAVRASAFTTPRGAWLAVVSGGITSGLGYAIWYRALPRLSVTQAAVAQLSVPVLAALGAVIFLGEPLDAHLAGSGALVLGGVGLALWARSHPVPR